MKCENREGFPFAQRSQIYVVSQERILGQNLTKQTLAYDRVIRLNSYYTHTFLLKLVSEVHKCVMFEGYAILKSNADIHKTQWSKQIDRTKACSKVSQVDISEHVISYRLDLIIMQQGNKYRKQIMQFQQSCNRIHQIIESILDRYKLESKVSFWITKFRLELLRLNVGLSQATEIQSAASSKTQQMEAHQLVINNTEQILREREQVKAKQSLTK